MLVCCYAADAVSTKNGTSERQATCTSNADADSLATKQLVSLRTECHSDSSYSIPSLVVKSVERSNSATSIAASRTLSCSSLSALADIAIESRTESTGLQISI